MAPEIARLSPPSVLSRPKGFPSVCMLEGAYVEFRGPGWREPSGARFENCSSRKQSLCFHAQGSGTVWALGRFCTLPTRLWWQQAPESFPRPASSSAHTVSILCLTLGLSAPSSPLPSQPRSCCAGSRYGRAKLPGGRGITATAFCSLMSGTRVCGA